MKALAVTEKRIAQIFPKFCKLSKINRTATTARRHILKLKLYWIIFQLQHIQLDELADQETRNQHKYYQKNKFRSVNNIFKKTLHALKIFLNPYNRLV